MSSGISRSLRPLFTHKKKIMKFLIIGCGNLGSELARELRDRGGKVVATYLNSRPPIDGVELVRCDVSNGEDIDRLMKKVGGDVTVFWLAANHNVDKVEVDPESAAKVNIDALGRFLDRYSDEIKRFFFSSSDCVYGKNAHGRAAVETDALAPVNEYGRQKAAAEKIVNAFGGVCLRFSLLIGESISGKKTFYAEMKTAVETGAPLELATNSRRPALSYSKAASIAAELSGIETLPGAINVNSDEDLSKFDIGVRLCMRSGKSADCFLPVNADKIPFTAPRVLDFRQDNSLLKRLLNTDHIESGL